MDDFFIRDDLIIPERNITPLLELPRVCSAKNYNSLVCLSGEWLDHLQQTEIIGCADRETVRNWIQALIKNVERFYASGLKYVPTDDIFNKKSFQLVGTGCYGNVHSAKLFNLSLIIKDLNSNQLDEYVSALKNEGLIGYNFINQLRALTPNFVYTYAVGEVIYLEHIKNEDGTKCQNLHTFLKTNPADFVLQLILVQVFSALTLADKMFGFRHNDLTTANILIRIMNKSTPVPIFVADSSEPRWMYTEYIPVIIDLGFCSLEVNDEHIIAFDVDVPSKFSTSKYSNREQNPQYEDIYRLLTQCYFYHQIPFTEELIRLFINKPDVIRADNFHKDFHIFTHNYKVSPEAFNEQFTNITYLSMVEKLMTNLEFLPDGTLPEQSLIRPMEFNKPDDVDFIHNIMLKLLNKESVYTSDYSYCNYILRNMNGNDENINRVKFASRYFDLSK